MSRTGEEQLITRAEAVYVVTRRQGVRVLANKGRQRRVWPLRRFILYSSPNYCL